VEYWAESDKDIEEDVGLEGMNVPPPDIAEVHESQEQAELLMISRWIITLLSVFQTHFYLTNRAVNGLLKFLVILLQFLGKFSTKISDLAGLLPRSIRQVTASFLGFGDVFQRKIVCTKCESLYGFDECLMQARAQTNLHCNHKVFRKKCNALLIKKTVTRNGILRLYLLKVFCFTSLKSSLTSVLGESTTVRHTSHTILTSENCCVR